MSEEAITMPIHGTDSTLKYEGGWLSILSPEGEKRIATINEEWFAKAMMRVIYGETIDRMSSN